MPVNITKLHHYALHDNLLLSDLEESFARGNVCCFQGSQKWEILNSQKPAPIGAIGIMWVGYKQD